MKKVKLFMPQFIRYCLSMTFVLILLSRMASAQKDSISITLFQGHIPVFCTDDVVKLACHQNVFMTLYPSDSIIRKINFGDGTDTTIASRYGSMPFYSIYFDTIRHRYSMTGTYTPKYSIEVYGRAKDSAIGFTYPPTYFTVKDTCATLKGKLYIDDNKNCVKESTERAIKGMVLSAVNTSTSDTTVIACTDSSGNYSVTIPIGSYLLFPGSRPSFLNYRGLVGDSLKPVCPLSGTKMVTLTSSTSHTVDFSAECITNDSVDLAAHVHSNNFVRGDTSLMTVWTGDWWAYSSYFCTNRTTTFTLTLHSKQNYCGVVLGSAPTSILGKVLSWSLSGDDLSKFKVSIKVSTDTTAHIGDTLCVTAYVAPATGYPDPSLTNNTVTLCEEVTSSFDPNEKEVMPKGNGKEGYIKNNTPLTYTIHFQNTGTAPARNITIVDSFDSDIDFKSFHVITSSHNMKTYISDGKVIKFRFNDIYLPDSGKNYYGSMGYITYGVIMKKSLPAKTEIKNTARIYFDYNDPIITNTTVNTIQIPTLVQHVNNDQLSISVYPNPANQELSIISEKTGNYTVEMLDLMGRRIIKEQSFTKQIIINTQNVSEGLYIINLIDNQGNKLNSKVLIQH